MTRLAIICVAVLLGGESLVLAQPRTLGVSQYAHSAWRNREGFVKGSISAIAQTPDGYLWLGTDYGLVRFDGVRSMPWQPPRGHGLPSNDIWGLLASRDGGLWIGTSKGLAKLTGGTLTQFDQFDGQYVNALLEDRDGTVWVGTIALGDARVCAIAGSRVECHGGNRRFGNVVTSLHEDRNGRIWAAVGGGVWRVKPGPPEFHHIGGAMDFIQGFVTAERGSLVAGNDRLWRFVDGKTETYQLPGMTAALRADRLGRDRHGNLWIGTRGQGLVHVTQGQTDVFTAAQGLSGDTVVALFEDREGNIWVATTSGLDRFREIAVPTFGSGRSAPNAIVMSVLATTDGTVWFGANGILNRRKDSHLVNPPTDDGTRAGKRIASPNSLFQDRRGRLWISTLAGTGYLESDRLIWQRGIPGGTAVHAMTDDAEGNVWVALQDEGLYRVSPDGTTRKVTWATFGRKDFASAMAADPRRGVWIGFQDGGIVHFDADHVRGSYGKTDGLGHGRVNSLRFDRHGALWTATEGGLSRVWNGRVATLTSRNGVPCDAVHWALEDDAESIWLFMPCGLVRMSLADLESWAANVDAHRTSNRPVPTTVFDSSDGVLTRSYAGGFSPQAAKTPDGKIWFASLDGVSMIDPAHLPSNPLPPPVHVEQLIADRRAYDEQAIATGVRLPPLTRDVQIDYTALSLVDPNRMQFRYRLDGHDPDWQDVGTRRQAFYSDLPPGDYRFRVIAANNSGVWNDTGAAIQFAIAPAYYQTAWFRALALGTVLALVWSAYRIRIRVVERHQQEISALNERLMKAQEQERIRIAGELHDGVMQQLLAVTMMVGTAKRRIADDSEARPTLEKISDKLVEVGSDIRRLSHDLHPPILQEAGLPQAMRAYCEQFSASSGVPVTCEADDGLDNLSRGAALALFRIMQEALGNAAKHAKAGRITVRLARAAGAVTLTIADDGVGFDRNLLSTSGGLGLIMMRERAGQLNGQFRFETAPGRGTVITVEIPFR